MTSEQKTAMYDQPDPTDDEREALAAIVDQNADVNNPTFHRNTANAILAAGFHRTVQGEPRHFAPYGSYNALCDETVPQTVAWGAGEYADQRFTVRRDGTTCVECRFRMGLGPNVQGEPSDAVVQAALRAYWGGAENAQAHGSTYGMRAALRAAAVQGGETR